MDLKSVTPGHLLFLFCIIKPIAGIAYFKAILQEVAEGI